MIILLLSLIVSVNAFSMQKMVGQQERIMISHRSTLNMDAGFEAIRAPVESYVGIWTPMFKSAMEMGVPEAIIHWGHGAGK